MGGTRSLLDVLSDLSGSCVPQGWPFASDGLLRQAAIAPLPSVLFPVRLGTDHLKSQDVRSYDSDPRQAFAIRGRNQVCRVRSVLLGLRTMLGHLYTETTSLAYANTVRLHSTMVHVRLLNRSSVKPPHAARTDYTPSHAIFMRVRWYLLELLRDLEYMR